MSTKNWAFVAALLMASFVLASSVDAALVMTDLSDQTENFNSLDANFGSHGWTDDSTITGWYWQVDGSESPYYSSNGASTSGRAYAYRDNSSDTDIAVGSQSRDTFNDGLAIGVVFENNSGDDIASINVAYTGEQWRDQDTTADTFAFSYRVDSTEITDFDPDNSTPGDWTNVTALDFVTTVNNNDDIGLGGVETALSQAITISVQNGEFLSLRWVDHNIGGVDQGIAIDDLRVSFIAAVPEPAAALIFGCVVLGFRTLRRKQA